MPLAIGDGWEEYHDEHDTVVGDQISVTVHNDGRAEFALWFKGEKKPFAIAHVQPACLPGLAALLFRNMKPAGTA